MGNDSSTMSAAAHRLTIVIPALNEADAIGDTIQRCLDARDHIRERSGIESVEIIVVSDGSTDETPTIARGFSDVTLIEFQENRGYGAAIKYGIRTGTGDLVGFLDADGTCDPLFFADLCRAVLEDGAEIALGSRMSSESQMPFVRTVGNRAYAILLSLLSNRKVADTASGMRVMKRASLQALGPLPDGLHYTPAMSARAVMKGMKVSEIPMSYDDRIGESKLRVSRDGWLFLQAIFDGVLLFRPERMLILLALIALGAAAFLSISPIEFYISNRQVEEWMIYRFVVGFLFGSAGILALTATALISRMSELTLRRGRPSFWMSLLVGSFRGLRLLILVGAVAGVSVALVWPGILEYANTGQVSLHWSRVIVAAFGLLMAFQAVTTAVLLRITDLWLEFASTHRTVQAD